MRAGSDAATISFIVFSARSNCSGEIVRRSPVTRMCSATTLSLPSAVPTVPVESSVTAVPPTATPGLKVRYCSSAELRVELVSTRAASNTAPAPTSGVKICPECAGVPVTVSVHEPAPRRDVIAVFGSPEPSSNPSAAAAPFAASLSVARESSSGVPDSSSSPSNTIVTFILSSARHPSARATQPR